MSEIFNTEFYPTPKEVIRKMVYPYRNNIKKLQILEPSAGSGAILDYITTDIVLDKVPKENVYAIENNSELVYVLQGKGYKICERLDGKKSAG